MTYQAVGRAMEFPFQPDLGLNTSGTNFTFDGANDRLVAIFRIPKTGTLANVHYRVAVSSSPNLTLRVELRTVNATTGLPNSPGTLYGSSTSITSANPTTGAKTAAVNCTGATRGDLVALVIDLSAFTSGSIQLLQRAGGSAGGYNFPYQVTNTASSDVIAATSFNNYALEYSGGVYYPGEQSIGSTSGATSNTVSNSGTTRRGNSFIAPFAMRACGMWVDGDLDGDCFLRLRLSSDDSILATVTLDKDVRGTTGAGRHVVLFDNGDTIYLKPGVRYIATLEGNSATACTIWIVAFDAAAMMDTLGGGQNCYATLYNGSYSDSTASRYGIGILFDQVDDGARDTSLHPIDEGIAA